MEERKRDGEGKIDDMMQKREIAINIKFLSNHTIILALNKVYKTCFMGSSIWGNAVVLALNCSDIFLFFQNLIHTNEMNFVVIVQICNL